MNLTLIPSGLVLFRFLISPFLLLDAWDGKTSIWFIVGFVAAFLSDIFDGIIARKLGVSTAKLRQADSWADVCLFSCIFVSAWIVHQDILVTYSVPLLMIVFAQLLWWVVNLVKYGKPASYHTYSAKFWGITLFIAIIALFGFDYAGVTLWLTCIAGTIHSLEEIAMTLILPVWTHDVLSIFHALNIRQESLSKLA
ncbi:CDP-alcohol phosphatidyltransferase family protein [Nostoc sp. UCD121]|uniref:CDP-alcohol phosphatidyltransferase family protein n=1 Tax=unclassified Nostoc TaxID=2593658 RepID=UPI001629C645|nr:MULTISPECIES: CDP-alcohol phosphatidyltransferase family protein [unclassified Nostoc]MBC1220797.1 CDP-alcohol phosphatidyltransferase family protein [Nostoc sp. UCD120]MBC1279576.1 CDP-alcohol phosphatidyltransferase family protein [Nostoc sp. UCD121]MBC1294524.1 CDP-alcohol phosphatidyltransferase family protein [Nostoc sp. UCD122]